MVLKLRKSERRWWARAKTPGAHASSSSTHLQATPVSLQSPVQETRQEFGAVKKAPHRATSEVSAIGEDDQAGFFDHLFSGVMDVFDVTPAKKNGDDASIGLHTACRQGDLTLAKLKIKTSPGSIMAFHHGGTPLFHATLSGNKRLVAYLLKHGAYDRGGICAQMTTDDEIRKLLLTDLRKKKERDEIPLIDKYDVACSDGESSRLLNTEENDWDSTPDWDTFDQQNRMPKAAIRNAPVRVESETAPVRTPTTPVPSAMELYQTDNSFANSSTYTEDLDIAQESAKFDKDIFITNLASAAQDMQKHRDEEESSRDSTATSSSAQDSSFDDNGGGGEEEEALLLPLDPKRDQPNQSRISGMLKQEDDAPFLIISCCE